MIFGRDSGAIHRILVVEDEPLVAFDNEHFLTQAGYEVAGTVESYDSAVAVLDRQPVDLVIADVRLSGDRDGVALAEYARERGIAVLFVTGACPVDAQHLAIGCLAKPYTQRDLLLAIQAADAILRKAKLPRIPRSFSLFRQALDDDAA